MAFRKGQSTLGMDVGSRKTKVVQLAYSGKGLPDMSLCEILDTGLDDENFTANIKAFISDARLKGVPTAASFDHSSMVIRRFEFPPMPELDLIESIRWGLRDLVDADVDGYVIMHSKIGDIEEGDTVKGEYVVYAVDRAALDDYKIKLEALGLAVFMIEPIVVSLATTLDRKLGEVSGYHAGIDIGAKHTRFYVVGNRRFIFSRPLPGISYDDFEKSPDDFHQKLAIDVQKSIDTFQVNFHMQAISSLALSGGGSLIPDLVSYLSTNMGLDVSVLNPFQDVVNEKSLSENIKPPFFAQALSLAMLTP